MFTLLLSTKHRYNISPKCLHERWTSGNVISLPFGDMFHFHLTRAQFTPGVKLSLVHFFALIGCCCMDASWSSFFLQIDGFVRVEGPTLPRLMLLLVRGRCVCVWVCGDHKNWWLLIDAGSVGGWFRCCGDCFVACILCTVRWLAWCLFFFWFGFSWSYVLRCRNTFIAPWCCGWWLNNLSIQLKNAFQSRGKRFAMGNHYCDMKFLAVKRFKCLSGTHKNHTQEAIKVAFTIKRVNRWLLRCV